MSDVELAVEGVSKYFGGFCALDGVSFEIRRGEALGLVGPNGSGKTTLLNVICGLYPPTKGRIFFRGSRVDGHKPHLLAKAGINRTFQLAKPFKSLTVRENIDLALSHRNGDGASLDEILNLTNLTSMVGVEAGNLNAGQQKRLDLARAISLEPSVLFIDELGAGLNPVELNELAEMLRKMQSGGRAIVVVEHLMGFLEKVVDHVLVLNAGKEIFRGELRQALGDQDVKRVFLGDSVGN